MDLTRFEWDEYSMRRVERHRIAPEEAEQILDNDPVYQYPQQAEDEERHLIYGETNAGRMLVVALTVRGTATDQKRRYMQERS